jgi:hypothetical protein
MIDPFVIQITIWVILAGWGINLLTALVSTLNDMYWGNTQIAQGLIACLAFSWCPFFVFFAGLKHFIFWTIGKNGP